MKSILKLACLVVVLLVPIAPVQALVPGTDANGKPFPSLAPMLKRVNPAVVNISTFSTRKYDQNPLLNDPFFRRFFNIPDQAQPNQQAPQRRQQAAGSGVIVNAAEGIVLTNFHVIRNADEINVALLDGRNFKAKLVGSDSDLDVAVLKIDGDNLTQVKIADSNLIEVGDYVVAIGNPFGLGQTVTTGVVSALGRSGLGIEGYENFIQTDASINPGNSGGALVNLAGELVGINTAIIAPGGGNVGIGFAIPMNMVKVSMQQILEHGEVKRGQIGVGIQDITPQLREAFNLENGQFGVLVSSVVENSPAAKAGIRSGDIIIEVDGQATASSSQLRSRIGIHQIGDKLRLTILRGGKRKVIEVEVGEPQAQAQQGNLSALLAGVGIENNPDGNGVRVVTLAPNSAAANSGLRPGDVIVGANRREVTDIESLKAALAVDADSLLLHVNRRGGSLFIVIR
jgi:Do/DeqQ family serine protease